MLASTLFSLPPLPYAEDALSPVISANTQARVEGYFRREWNLAAGRTLDMADDQAFLLPVVIDLEHRAGEKLRVAFVGEA